jgi:hypothetical protein
MDFGITGVAAITALCYLLGQAVKASPIKRKWIPLICGGFGGILGVVGMYVMTQFPASDPITAAAIGAVSGLAATGAHQICKQIKNGSSSS